ncbi:hypothetical protein [Halosegnis marinus]|uniref:hypothetical protein n=1 Tax=Halosegnis marinus TaxID=3034023 RepID=UPI00360D7267
MDSRIRLIVASLVAASVAYLFAVIAFTGTLDLVAAGVFLGCSWSSCWASSGSSSGPSASRRPRRQPHSPDR